MRHLKHLLLVVNLKVEGRKAKHIGAIGDNWHRNNKLKCQVSVIPPTLGILVYYQFQVTRFVPQSS